MPAAPDPSPARMAVCALLVLVFAGSIWGWIEWRTAPPPPPKVVMPELPQH
jgi:hypothetical protein